MRLDKRHLGLSCETLTQGKRILNVTQTDHQEHVVLLLFYDFKLYNDADEIRLAFKISNIYIRGNALRNCLIGSFVSFEPRCIGMEVKSLEKEA